MKNQLLRNSLKLAVAVFITATIAVWTERIEFVWYPLLAAIIVVDDNDDQTVSAATARILGTVMGGLITFMVHTILSGWMGVLVSLLLMIPVLEMLRWQSALGTASLISIMFLMIPSHAALMRRPAPIMASAAHLFAHSAVGLMASAPMISELAKSSALWRAQSVSCSEVIRLV